MKASFSFRVTIVMVILAVIALVLLRRDSCGGQCSASHGTRWAILLAGSKDFENYRHQADICHAYHLLKRGGLRDENIVVFMYDDIAYNKDNPIPGMLFNEPYGTNVYSGVPKDYTGEEVNTKNLLAALLGNSYAITGGSGKVVDSSHCDYIFIYYADHGNVGYLAMPSGPPLKSVDLMNALKKKHSVGGYKSMVIYVEACKSGSMFKRLPKGLSIYVLTASRAEENSYATHCSLMSLSGEKICLADQFSASWMEHSEHHNLDVETLHQQYEVVKRSTIQGRHGSHVMQFGDIELGKDSISMYMGSNPKKKYIQQNYFGATSSSPEMTQDDATLLYYCYKLYNQNTSAPLQCPLSHGPVLVGSEKYVGLPPVETGESQSI